MAAEIHVICALGDEGELMQPHREEAELRRNDRG
jgi:hypothetical protein